MDDLSSQFSLDIPIDQLNLEDNLDDLLEQLESKKTQNTTIWPKLLGHLLSTNTLENADYLIDLLLKDKINEYTARSLAICYLFSDHGLKDSVNVLLYDYQSDEQKSIATISAAFIVFIACEDEDSTLKLISLLKLNTKKSEKKHKSSPLSLIASITSIFVLSTTIEDDEFIAISKDLIPDLIFYMESDHLELHLVCSEVLAYIYQRFNSLKVFIIHIGRV